jgi:hypothetical protein
MVQKFLPCGPSSSKMAYEIYRNRHSSEADFKLISDMYARVMGEDKVLCINAQRNLERGVFTSGQLHPKYEKAPLFFQNTVREVITEHFEAEKSAGKEIWPAKHRLTTSDVDSSDRDEEICAVLSCGGRSEGLVW